MPELSQPPAPWTPARPAIIRPAEHVLLRPGAFRPMTGAERRATVAELVRAGRLTEAEARQAMLLVPVVGWGGGDSFPSVAGTNTSVTASDTTTHTISLPTSISSGDLVLAFISCNNGVSVTWPGAWSEIADGQQSGGGVGAGQLAVGYLIASGGEMSVVATSNQVVRSAHCSVRVVNYSQVPDATSLAAQTTTNPNPPSHTPASGSGNYLWLAAIGVSAGQTISGQPSGYTNLLESLYGPADTLNSARVAVVRKTSTGSSDDPSAWSITGSRNHYMSTIAVKA